MKTRMIPCFGLILLTLCLLAGNSISHAQTVATLEDNRCDTTASPGNCDPNAPGCVSTTFTVPTDGFYCVKAATGCTLTNCAHAKSCASVYGPLGNLVMYAKSPCNDPGNCEHEDCTGDSRAFLQTRVTYTFYVCLIPCEGADCTDIPDCTAAGKVYHE